MLIIALLSLGLVAATSAQVTIAEGETSADLRMADWYPQGSNTVLVCETSGFEATSYDWVFGDGDSLMGIERDDVFHAYPGEGVYDASCTAHGDGVSETGTLTVVIGEVPEEPSETSARLTMNEGASGGNKVKLNCIAEGFEATSYDWVFGDGDRLIGIENDDVFHTYPGPGTYDASCTAHGDGVSETGMLEVVVDDDGVSAMLEIAEGFPEGNDVILFCRTEGFVPHTFDWVFGDGDSLTGLDRDNVWHNYPGDGVFNASCTAHGDNVSASGSLAVVIGEGTAPEEPPAEPEEGDVELRMADFYPQGLNVTLVCDANFDASSYDWTFGDGDSLTGIDEKQVFHGYDEPGEYTATCTAHGENVTGSDALTFTVGDGEAPEEPPEEPEEPEETSADLRMADWYPQGTNTVLVCETSGFTPTSYDWVFGDGDTLTDVDRRDVFHDYPGEGVFDASCTAHGAGVSETGMLEVVIGEPELVVAVE